MRNMWSARRHLPSLPHYSRSLLKFFRLQIRPMGTEKLPIFQFVRFWHDSNGIVSVNDVSFSSNIVSVHGWPWHWAMTWNRNIKKFNFSAPIFHHFSEYHPTWAETAKSANIVLWKYVFRIWKKMFVGIGSVVGEKSVPPWSAPHGFHAFLKDFTRILLGFTLV